MSTRWLLEWWTPWHEYLFTMKQNSFHHLPHLGFLCNVTQHHHLSLKFWSGAECPTCTDGRAEVLNRTHKFELAVGVMKTLAWVFMIRGEKIFFTIVPISISVVYSFHQTSSSFARIWFLQCNVWHPQMEELKSCFARFNEYEVATRSGAEPNIFLWICTHTQTITISIDLCPPMPIHSMTSAHPCYSNCAHVFKNCVICINRLHQVLVGSDK